MLINNTILISDYINIPCNPFDNSLGDYFIEVQGTTTVIMSCSILYKKSIQTGRLLPKKVQFILNRFLDYKNIINFLFTVCIKM